MALIGAVIVGLLIVIAGLLVLLHHQGEHHHAQAERRHEEQRAQAERRHEEQRAQAFEATIAIVETLHLVGHAAAAEVREAARQRRNDLRLANQLPRVSEPPRTWSTTPARSRSPSSRRADEKASAPHDHDDDDPPSLPSPVAPPSLPSFEPNEDDEQTPTSGWTAEQIQQHLANASSAEERAQ